MLNVICLKHGTKYGPEYVNRLYNMIQRNLTIPHRFICFTDNSRELNSNIEVRALPSMNLQGWWWKPYIFKPDHFDTGDVNFFLDLDMVIISNIDKLINYLPGEFIGLEDVGRIFNRTPKLGSAVLRWTSGSQEKIWTTLELDPKLTKHFPGDQDYIWHLCQREIKFFPADWIRSYKWEVRNRSELVRLKSGWMFKNVRNPEVHSDTAILAFHGTPNPADVADPIIIDNWC
jgi:hypothetical protein